MRRAALWIALSLAAACGGKSTAEPDGSGCAADAGLGFGAACTRDCECIPGVCHTYGAIGTLCTLSCTGNSQCPSGSEGQKCNAQGVCKP